MLWAVHAGSAGPLAGRPSHCLCRPPEDTAVYWAQPQAALTLVPPCVGSGHEAAAAPLAAGSSLLKTSRPTAGRAFSCSPTPWPPLGAAAWVFRVQSPPPCHLAAMLFLPTAQAPDLDLVLAQMVMGSFVGTVPLSRGLSMLLTLPWCLCLIAGCLPVPTKQQCVLPWLGQLGFPQK